MTVGEVRQVVRGFHVTLHRLERHVREAGELLADKHLEDAAKRMAKAMAEVAQSDALLAMVDDVNLPSQLAWFERKDGET